MRINLDYFIILCDLFKNVPPRTPKRLNVIQSLAEQIWQEFQQDSNPYCKEEIFVDIEREETKLSESFQINNVSELSEHMHRFTQMDSIKSQEFEKILLPTMYFCCGKLITIDGRHFAAITLYTENGVLRGRSYHGNCKCGKTFYNGFFDDKKNEIRKFDDPYETEYILFRSGVAFSRRMLINTDFQISIGVVSFESAAEIYNNIWPSQKPLHKRRLEDAWFIHKILKHVTKFAPWPRNKNSELDVEKLCLQVYEFIRKRIDSKWMTHVCSEVGCKERLVVIDGNEKLYRTICAAEKSKIIGDQGNINTYDICIRNPTRGNQHSDASKFCEEHINGKSGEGKMVIDLRPITRSFSRMLPLTVTSGLGCKEDKKVDRFYTRTAGMFYIFRSCGVRLSHWEMYTAESLSGVFLWLIDLFGESPSTNMINGIIYDRACDLHPFLKRLSKEGNNAAKEYKKIIHIVDIFHVEKHIMSKCVLSSPECLYHPHLKRFQYVRNMNTEVAEQWFNRINPFKYITRKMTYARRLLFLKFLDDSYNERLSKKIET